MECDLITKRFFRTPSPTTNYLEHLFLSFSKQNNISFLNLLELSKCKTKQVNYLFNLTFVNSFRKTYFKIKEKSIYILDSFSFKSNKKFTKQTNL